MYECQYPNLFKPLRLGNTILRNRIFAAPTGYCDLTVENIATEPLMAYYESKARGGCAVVHVGEAYIDSVHGVDIPKYLKLDSDDCVSHLATVADAINKHGAIASMLLIGIGFHCVGGVLPALFGETSMAMMFLGRFAFGIGYGLMQGIGISMSLKLVEDSRFRSHAMGWAVAAQYAMNMIAQVAVGHLCAIKWNYSFFVYLWSAVPFLVVLFLCPKFELDRNDTSTAGGKLEEMAKSGSLVRAIKKLPPIVWVFSAIAIGYMLCYYPMFLVISKIVVGRGIGNSVTVGNAMVFYSVATIAGGIVFGFAEKLLKNKTMFVMLAVTGVTMLGLYFSHSFASVAAWLVVSGVFSTGIIPACISAFSESVEEENKFLATSIAESGVNIGAFLGTPYIALIEAFGGSADTAMFISPIIMLILGFVTLRFYKKDAKM